MTDAVDAMDVDELGRLEAAARERWGEGWTLDVTLWSDGSIEAVALRSLGEVRRDEPEQYVKRERLRVTDEGIERDLVVVRDEAAVDVLEERSLVE